MAASQVLTARRSAVFMSRMLRRATLLLALLAASGCGVEKKAARVRNVEGDLVASGFHTVIPNTPKKQDLLRRLTPHRLTEASRNGKPYYWYADPDGCRCVYVGGEEAYRRYDRLAQARDDADSDKADARMLRTIEAAEGAPPDAWFWQDTLPEYFPE
jgi:hypothetical protein